MFFSVGTFAQNITVKGTVADPNNAALAGVSVSTADRSVSAMADGNGNFSIAVPQGATLVFTLVGYAPVREVAAADMKITMQEDDVLVDAVTVVGIGYGTMRKSDLTGAITSVAADKLKQGVVTSAEQLLQGKVAGLTVTTPSGDPTQGSSVRLRGGTSLTASSSPLVVVDGIAGVDMNTILPSEIVSIDVLKDASAAAIYGSRGANGVLIVSTNRQGAGRSMHYSGYVALSNASKNLDLLSADQWRQYVRDNNVASAVDYGGNTDWQKELQRTAISHNHVLSFNNNTDKNGVRAVVSFQNTEGVIKTSSLNRLAGSVTAFQYGLKDKLRLEASIHANTDKYHPVDMGIYERAYNLNPTLPVKQNGKYTQIGGTNNNNPVELLDNRTDDQSRTRLLAYTKADLEILPELMASVNLSYEYNTQQGRYYVPSVAYNGITDNGYGRRNLGDYANYQGEAYLSYNKTFNDQHRLNAMAGYSYLNNVYEGFGAERRNFTTDDFLYNNLGAGTDARLGDVNSYKGEARLISFFGRVNYTFADRYMLTATIRRDGSSRFGDNHKWGIFPSVSAAWRVSEEAFMESTKSWLDNLKLRVGYGITGNQDGIGEYKSLALIGTSGSSYYDSSSDTWKQSYGPIQNPNPDLKWEQTAQINVGVDVSFLNRFNVSVDWYNKKTTDLLYTYTVPQPPYLYPTMLANVGDLSNKGIEFTLGANIIKSTDWTWNANLTLAYNKQEVDKLSNDLYQTDAVPYGNLHGMTGMSGIFTQTLREGYPVGTFWGKHCEGVDEDGKFILSDEDQYLGSAQPDVTLGFSTDLTWKNFDFSLAAYGMFGQEILNAQAMNISYPNRLPVYNVLDSWVGKNVTEGPIYSDYWIEKGSFLRIQSITLGYTLPVAKTWFSKIRFYFTAENPFVFTSYSGLDPEVNFSGLLSPGIDKSIGASDIGNNYYYPHPRTFIFGLNLSF
ncbi:SusC/RagA family TonB-linked outer membrane protein [Bacteroidia bacterium]|nr:SusC/RagA family TonB-linked outer membrane protein [Bacteroidia bacterium]